MKTFKMLFPALLGTVVEYYDYALYGFCASLLASQFFPTQDPSTALIKTFGIFVAGSFSKPFGAFLFGYIGDRFGRRLSLRISMIGIAVPTMLMGLLPNYAIIGWWAPFLLLLCRILQGMLTAGESEGARIFIYESIGDYRPCLMSSLSGIASMFGIYLASLAAAFVFRSKDPDIWRLPFLLGGIFGIWVFWIRCFIEETPAYLQYTQEFVGKKTSFLEVILHNKKAIIATVLFCGAAGGGYHFYLVFLGHYLSSSLQFITPAIAASNTAKAILIYTLVVPLAGVLGDKFGAFLILKWALYALLAAGLLNIMMIQQGHIPFWLMGITATALAFTQTPANIVLLRAFSVGERYRCIGFGHAIGSMALSGSATVISLWLWKVTEVVVAPLLYFIFLILLQFLAVKLFKPPPKPSPAKQERELPDEKIPPYDHPVKA